MRKFFVELNITNSKHTALTSVCCLFLTLSFFVSIPAKAQLVQGEDESRLYAETKQLNQFLRRFNGEENEKGDRYYPNDKQYRSEKLRKQYFRVLFDVTTSGLDPALVDQFGKDVLDKAQPFILQFHGGNWFSEVHATFSMNGKDEEVILFMELEKHAKGSRWVISKAYADMFAPYFKRDTVKVGQFLHPMSHELAFMNMRKAFSNRDSVSQYVVKRYRPDHLSLFLYEMKKGNLRFKTVNDMKFHFFQVPGWYFELSQFNRPGYNTGWLISNLVKVNSDKEKDLLKKHLYYEK